MEITSNNDTPVIRYIIYLIFHTFTSPVHLAPVNIHDNQIM